MPFFLHKLLGVECPEGQSLRVALSLQADGSVEMAADIPVGALVRFMRSSTSEHSIAAGARAAGRALAQLDGRKPHVALVCDCVSTRLRLGLAFDDDSPTGEAISVVLDVPGAATVRIAVEDRGIGILPAHRPYIFDRKYRAPGEQQVNGLGIGLYVSQQIVLRHGGRIDAQFPTEGGTRMIVTLPVGPVVPER